MILKNDLLTCNFDESLGKLVEITHKGNTIPFDGIAFDFGCDEKNQTGCLAYDSMLEFRTWNLPAIKPTKNDMRNCPITCEMTTDTDVPQHMPNDTNSLLDSNNNKIIIRYDYEMASISLVYELIGEVLSVHSVIENTSETVLYLNTFGFITKLCEINHVTFDFPSNVPIRHIKASELEPYQVIETGLVSFAVHSQLENMDMNLLFIDNIEKWSSGVYHDGSHTNYVYNAALEADLYPGSSLLVGTLYIQPVSNGNPYLKIRDFVDSLGYHPCEGGITDGIMYSCHPSGTMDSGFPLKMDLYEYAEQLPALKEMGIDHVWLLPVFDHNEDGVYHSNDQSVIDERYGGEEGCKYFCDKAHELSMTVLFDYVPHGPAPEFPLAKDNPDWPSKRRDGSLQDEWNCVSMDYNHPGYVEYTAELVHDHVKRFSVDGARIDCAMGGLSNWRPYKGERPSGNSIRAGVHITEAVRDGFLRGNKPSFILPENFYPLPNYYHCTDLFYGMNLYRVFWEIEPLLHTDTVSFVELLTDFLEREALITPLNYHKLRFLGNHDTVSWVWQSKRAIDCYGVEGAKALWAVITFIDGMPMIYQGDEDPAIYNGEGSNLTEYFTKIFKARKEYIPSDSNETIYLHTGTPVMAFIRKGKDKSCLVAVNLSNEEQDFDINKYTKTKDVIMSNVFNKIKPYSYQITVL